MNWKQVCDDPTLQDLPYKIELNRYGEIVMNAVRIDHAFFVEKISSMLKKLLPDGLAPPEFAIETQDGIRAPDVAWISIARALAVRGHLYSALAPEICVEVMSPGNALPRLLAKRDIYFAAGALEFWLCELDGAMRFFDAQGELERSRLAPAFPRAVVLFESDG